MFYNDEEKANKTLSFQNRDKNAMTDTALSFFVHPVQYIEVRHPPLKEKEALLNQASLSYSEIYALLLCS